MAGGTRRAFLVDFLSCTERQHIDGTNEMTLRVLRDEPALETLDTPTGTTNGEPQMVLRAVMEDGAFVERRIVDVTERDDDGQTTATITALGMLNELSYRGLVRRDLNDGKQTHNFQASGLTLARHVELYILPALAEAGQPWWALGDVEYADVIPVVQYTQDSPLSALRKLANRAMPPLEVGVRYDPGSAKYRIDVVSRVGAGAFQVRVHTSLNLRSFGLSRSARDVVNRVYAFGGADEATGDSTMGLNVWRIIGQVAVPGQAGVFDLTLQDPAGGIGPVAFDGQWSPTGSDNYQLLCYGVGGDDFDIMDSTEPNVLRGRRSRTGTGSTLVRHRIARNAKPIAYYTGGNSMPTVAAVPGYLTYVESPTAQPTALGPRVGFVERSDVTGQRNLVLNPLLRNWVGATGLPDFWFFPATPQWAKNVNPLFWKTGDASLVFTFPVDNGLTGAIRAMTSREVGSLQSGRLSFFIDFIVAVPEVDITVVVQLVKSQAMPDGTQTIVMTYPDILTKLKPGSAPETWRPDNTGTWERFAVDGFHDCSKYPVDQASINLSRVPGSLNQAQVIIDAAQMTNTKKNVDLIDGSGANLLLQAANDRLKLYADQALGLDISALDVNVVADDQFPYNRYTLGGPIMVEDELLGQQLQTRVLGWSRDWRDPMSLQVEISQAKADLARVLASKGRT